MPERPTDSPDTAHSAIIEDHHFVPPEGRPWERCLFIYGEGPKMHQKCGMGSAAHRHQEIEDTDPGRPPSMRHEPIEPRPEPLPVSEIDLSEAQEHMVTEERRKPVVPPISEAQIEAATGPRIFTPAGKSDMPPPLQTMAEGVAARLEEKEEPSQPGEDGPQPDYGDADSIEDLPDRERIMEVEGHKDDAGKAPFFYLPWDALEEVAYVMEFGANKYVAGNYRKGMSAGRLMSAGIRHWVAWWKGEDLDPESGRHHLAHSTCCALMCLETFVLKTARDDRYAYIDTKS